MNNATKRFETFGYAFILVFLALFLLSFFNHIIMISGPLFGIITTILFLALFVIFVIFTYFALKYALYLIDMHILSIPAQKINNLTFYCQNCKVVVEEDDAYCTNCGQEL